MFIQRENLREGPGELPLAEEIRATVCPREHSEAVAGPCRPETHFLPSSGRARILQSPLLSVRQTASTFSRPSAL